MKEIIVGNFNLYELLFYYVIYSFLGFCTEVIHSTLKTGKFVNRGFLNGPVCPIYGFGMVVVLLTLSKFFNDLFLLFFYSMLLTTFIEFLAGFALERIYKRKWWDYSNEPFNLMGYVCLRYAILWGLACVGIIKVVHPTIYKITNNINTNLGYFLLSFFAVIMIADFVITIIQIKYNNKKFQELKVISDELKKSSELIGEKLTSLTLAFDGVSKKIENSRIVKAFPRLKKDNKNK